MSLADRLDAAAAPVAQLDLGPDGGEFRNVRSATPITNWDDVLRNLGVDPDYFMVVGESVRVSSWDQSKRTDDGDRDVVRLYSYSGHITTRREAIDLPALYAASRRKPRKPLTAPAGNRATVPVIADVQVGKVAARGGTPELLDRLAVTRERLHALLRERRPSEILLPDLNDLFENFESGGNPMFTNDLSLSQQMDLAATEVYEFVKLCAQFAPVRVAVVPSNHTAWRRGKTELGRPGDDLGIFVHQQVQKVAQAAGLQAEWFFPAMYDESMVIDVLGTKVGLVHGNQYRSGGAVAWWAKQQHGGQPVGAADILLTGHFHHLSILPTGKNPYTSRSKWWIQAPTLDNGSDWFRNKSGEDSNPGLLVFDITEDGFDLQSLTVL